MESFEVISSDFHGFFYFLGKTLSRKIVKPLPKWGLGR